MMVTPEEAKEYLRVDYPDEDAVIADIIAAAEKLALDTLRAKKLNPKSGAQKIAVLYAVSYLFEHRENADTGELTRQLRYILATEREAAF